ncbi:CPBP family intramembrane glutamic endopeptidase [Chlamydiifrater phoenicopteri]|uniref:CPBP family intramembrane glutamic endopeptidase n=1 Tax=Chlamydiifrater phoenicopteri TaxID=2681469 RepID=UPI001BCB6583|nr:CPBP family intramembrane glutamic endopeptidase [Chlamydiifrater phoenicopteri]
MPVWLFFLWVSAAFLALRGKFFSLPQGRFRISITGFQLSGAFLLYLFSGITIALLSSNNNGKESSPFIQGCFITTVLVLYLYSLPQKTIHTVLWAGGSSGRSLKKLFNTTLRAWILAVPITQLSSLILSKILASVFDEKFLTPQAIAKEVQEGLSTPLTSSLLLIVSVAILLPISEEIVFRGFLQNFLKKRFSIRKSLVLSSVLFSLAHVENSLGSLVFVPVIFILSLMIGFVYEKERSLVAPMLLHTLYNGSQLAFSRWL